MPLDRPFDDIGEKDILELIDDQVFEKKSIDYKRDRIGPRDSDKKEFLFDISSFANASGGYLLLGVDENGGIPPAICGVGAINGDSEIARLENLCRDGIQRRIAPGIQMKAINVQDKGVVLLIRVPRSWSAPHMVVFQSHNKFYSRNSNGKYLMDVAEIQSAFLRSETLAQRIRDFRVDRLSLIGSDQTPVRLDEGPKIVLHMVPANFADPGVRLDLARSERHYLKLLGTTGFIGPYYNLDGLVSMDGSHSYAQRFWTGAIETVNCSLLVRDSAGTKIIPSVALEKDLMETASGILSFQEKLGVALPVVVMLSFLNVRGFRLAVDPRQGNSLTLSDRDDLFIPEALVRDFSSPPEVFLGPIIDAIWNAFGFRSSPHFDKRGN